jgi:hypothetical protein
MPHEYAPTSMPANTTLAIRLSSLEERPHADRTRDGNFAPTRPDPPRTAPPRTDFTRPVEVAGRERGKTFAPITGAGR